MAPESSSTFPRSAGVLLHPTSLPNRFGIGDLGAGARAFVDWLHEARLGLWQVLPLVPPGPGGSPYASTSAFAGSPLLIDLEDLVARGLLEPADLEGGANGDAFPPDRVDFARVVPWKHALVRRAAARFARGHKRDVLEAFRHANPWVEELALFTVLKDLHGGKRWLDWEAGAREHEAAAMAAAKQRHAAELDVVVAEQVLFDEQWRALHGYCAERGVRVIGDVPIYVDLDSADVWSNRSQFLLKSDGTPLGVSGVPPDAFTELGQLWGNPLYDWKRMRTDGHAWWVERLRRMLSLCDVVRIDHFRAFAAYWAVPFGAEDARGGQWVKGPGALAFHDLEAALGPLPVILEDLGVITPDVIALREQTGLPGMKVLQFAWEEGAEGAYLPHHHVPNCVVYTGTHDNDTSLGFWLSAPPHVQDHIRRYLCIDGHDFVWDFIRAAFASVAHTAIVPMQDVLCLDRGARMNTPGIAEGNWSWRVRREAFNADTAVRLRTLAELYGRARR
ncbi:MAG: 4-alpha-glucanotransferase [Deltaproteobacteria bacterium]|nr:4-alpha-glucanotransferase [Deltaproteobacteria bacterium]